MDAEGALGKVVNSVAVITASSGGKSNGMTAAWVTRVSYTPPMVAVSVGHGKYTHELIKDSKAFCVNILAEGQDGLSNSFGTRSGRTTDKFEGVGHRAGESGSPIIEDVAGYLDCRMVDAVDAGDHTIFIGEIVDAGSSNKKPMLYNY